jgi:hypothetical protein
VAITAFMWDAISQCASNSGCDGFLNKPVDAKRLLQEVEKWVNHVHLSSRPPAHP